MKNPMNREDVTEVVNVCDAEREGELIFRSSYYLSDCQKYMNCANRPTMMSKAACASRSIKAKSASG